MTGSDIINGQKKPDSGLQRSSTHAILFVMYGWRENGGGTLLPRKIAYELTQRGYRVSVLYASLDDDASLPPYTVVRAVDAGVNLYGVINRPARFSAPDNPQQEIDDPAIRQIFCKVLDDVNPTLVHFHNFHGLTFSIAEETYRRNIPSCFTAHNHYLIDPELQMVKHGVIRWSSVEMMAESDAVARNPHLQSMYVKRMETSRFLLNKWVDLTLAVSNRQRDLLILFGGDETRIAMLHQVSPLADQLWNDQAHESQRFRPIKRPLQVGYLGAIIPVKGVQILVAAAQAFTSDELQLHLYGFGPASFEDDLRSQDVRRMVTFHGPYDPDTIGKLAQHIDVAVIPSLWEEPAPTLVLTELHAMRVPVIGANVGGIPELITEGIDGVLYPPEDLEALVEQLRVFVDKPAVLETMRNNLCFPTHTFSSYMEQLERIYSTLLSSETFDARDLILTAPQRPTTNVLDRPTITWQGGLFVHHSLAHVNRELCLKLLERGFEISFSPTQPDEFSAAIDPRFKRLEACRNKPLNHADVTVRHQWPPDFSPVQQGKLVVIQPWEFGSAPVSWVAQINQNVDELWVPSHFVRDCYLQSGVSAGKVQVVPNGVATDHFHPEAPPCPLLTIKSFRFLFVGGTIYRKGIDILLAAYSAAFTAADDVCLVIKDMGGNSIYKGQTAQGMIAAFKKVPEHPEILYIESAYDNVQMAALYTACQCLVHPYRGEGFGLPIAEGMACGLAPLVTGYGAALDFCPPEIAWLIPATPKQLPDKLVGNLETVDFPWLAEPDVDALTSLMSHAFNHQDEVQKRGRAAHHYIRQHFTWDHAAKIADQRLKSLTKGTEVDGVLPEDGTLQQHPAKNKANESEATMQNYLVQTVCLKAGKLAQRGDVDAAVQIMLNEGILVDPESPFPYLALAEILMAAGRFQEALGVASEMPAVTNRRFIYEIEAQCYCALGDDMAARKTAMLAGEQSPLALVTLGTLAAREGDIALGEQLFRQAITIDLNCAKAWLSLGMILWSQGNHQDAWESIKQAVSLDQLNADTVRIMRDMASRMV